MELKLNKKRTLLIGFAFFGILLLWQVYDSWCPTFLTDILTRRFPGSSELDVQWMVGLVMALDNLAALFLLPIFGKMSDKTNTRIGKRMPYILVGTVVSAVAFPFIPVFFHNNNVGAMIATMAIVLVFMMMYRNPAVALMPDLTPKPLRARANGIINIVGYFGGAFATVLGLFFVLSGYIRADQASRSLWQIEAPFLIASVIMLISAAVLFFTVKENKIAEEMKVQMEEGERLAAIEAPVTDEGPMPKANKVMLLAILAAEFLWFMSDNALATYSMNYVIYSLKSVSSKMTILTIIGGAASVLGFAFGGSIADRIGRKWTITLGLAITSVALAIMCLTKTCTGTIVIDGVQYQQFPKAMYAVWVIKGFGMSLVHICSFPMVVELCSSKKIGQFTGYYYAASMAAQTVTPGLLGLFLLKTQAWSTVPLYAAILVVASLAVFTTLVKNIKSEKVANAKGVEAIGQDD